MDFTAMSLDEGCALVKQAYVENMHKQADIDWQGIWDSVKAAPGDLVDKAKNAPWAQYADDYKSPLVGASVGGLAGLASTIMDPKERRRPIARTMLGALLGGGAGALYDTIGTASSNIADQPKGNYEGPGYVRGLLNDIKNRWNEPSSGPELSNPVTKLITPKQSGGTVAGDALNYAGLGYGGARLGRSEGVV